MTTPSTRTSNILDAGGGEHREEFLLAEITPVRMPVRKRMYQATVEPYARTPSDAMSSWK